MDLTERYVRIAHFLEAHTHGYIDGYFGPAEWATPEHREAHMLAEDVAQLEAQVRELPDGGRRRFLEAQARAMRTSVRLLSGEEVPYAEEVRGLYDIDPVRGDEAEFDAALTRLRDLLPGHGDDLVARETPLREAAEVKPERLQAVLDVIVPELRARTGRLYGLPDNEGFDVRLVTNEPWSGYNWPLGNRRSRVDVNTDLPVLLSGLPDLMTHEGYPGHHTEHAWKEALLAEEEGRLEHTILLINAPECVVSEGIATVAREMVMTDAELRDLVGGELARVAGVDADAALALLDVAEAKKALSRVNGNAALLLHEAGRPDEEVVEYLRHYGLRSDAQARKSLEFLRHPNFRSYTFTYTAGADLLRPLLKGEDRHDVFRRLLTEPLTPGEIRGLVTERAASGA
ncbi:hypothetical protein [Deinococcus pimensis]|uniref:hypothetical protein n=1 Tax=Deinococcus pimensis TaxID=309888 RepID=UPI0004828401|nr:hypothetical protein [Deinococcus pimensis]